MTAKARPRQPVPKRHWRTSGNDPLPTPAEALASCPKTPAPAHDDRKPAIVAVKRRPGRFGDAPDLTPEEHRQRGDAADALFREIVRQATE
jgi:hypothetical protein